MDKITIGTLWDGRTDYLPVEYVNRLFSMCKRHCSRPFDFVLMAGPGVYEKGLTSALERQIRVIPSGLPYWWGGFHFWKADPPGVETEMILHLDLDLVIVGALDPLFDYPANTYMQDWPAHLCPQGNIRDVNVSVSWIKRGGSAKVWEIYESCGRPQWDPLSPDKGPLHFAVQGIVNDPANGIEHNKFPEELVSSYKLWARDNGIPKDCRVVVFHGRPKMHELKDQWIKENWR